MLSVVGGCCNCSDDAGQVSAVLGARRAPQVQADSQGARVMAPASRPRMTPAPVAIVSTDAPANLLFCMSPEDAQAAGTGAEAQETARTTPYAHWSKRQGPGYPGDFWHSVGRDAKEFLPIVWDDTKAVATNEAGWIGFAAAGITGIALSGNRGNDQVQEHFEKHSSQLNTFWDTVGDVGGNPGTHFAVAGAMYLGGLAMEDDQTYAQGKMMLSALSINGLVTLGLKAAARTESPNGDEAGWPSGHTSSSFCFAAVMYETYGPAAGLPLYAFAAFVGYERIDARNHDFNDVISGAIIGAVIGHLVAQNHQDRTDDWHVVPYASPDGTVGLNFMKSW
jgi:hypothetical protein